MSYNGEVPKDIARASISLNVRGAGGSSTDLDLNVMGDINSSHSHLLPSRLQSCAGAGCGEQIMRH